MSDVIDQRIVEMSFDNKEFEKGIAKSHKSLKDFEDALGFEGAISGINKFQTSFSKTGAVIFSIIQNLTNRVVDFGIKMAKSFTMDPMLAGMSDYETKLTTMQTITNATGKTIQEVETYFSDLDTYADKTIYNLTDMTSSMAKFVNAGVGLEKAVPAIKGIANMTALAGQNGQAASIAMYNLSQSIAGGFLTTLDYKSLNLANVATIEWKNQMIEAAIAAGKLKAGVNGYITPSGKAYSAAQLFTDGLKDQWATTDVLLKVLGDYGDETTAIGKKAQAAAQDVKSFTMLIDTLKESVGTGWTRSFELIIGDLEESKQLWTGISNAVGSFLNIVAEGRNTMLEFWHDNGGREAFLNGLRNSAIAVIKVLLSVSMAMDQIFPPKTQQQFLNMFLAFERITEGLIISDEAAGKLQRAFKGLFAIFDIGFKVVKFFANVLLQIGKELFPGFSGGLLDVLANLGDFIVILHDIILANVSFQDGLKVTAKFISIFADNAKLALYTIIGLVSGLVDGSITINSLGESIGSVLMPVKDMLVTFAKGKTATAALVGTFNEANNALQTGNTKVSSFSKAFDTSIDNISSFISLVSRKLLPILGWVGDGLKSISLGQIGIIALGVGLIAISRTLLKIFMPISGVFDSFSRVLDSTSKAIKGFTLGVKADAMFTIAKSIALLAASLIALTFVPADKLAVSLSALSIMMFELIIAMKLLNGIQNPAKIGIQLTALSTGLFIIAKAASKFENMSWEGLLKAGVAIGSLLAMIILFTKALSKIPTMVTGMLSFSAGLIALSASLLVFSLIPFDNLSRGSGALLTMLGVLALYTKLISGKDISKSSIGMFSFAVGMIGMIGALSLLAKLPFDVLLKGGVSLLGLLTILGLYTKMVSDRDITKTTKGLVGFGVGLMAMSGALAILGGLPFDTLAKGTISLLGLLTVLGLFINLTNGKDVSVTGGALIGLGLGMIALTGALAILGSLKLSTLVQGAGAIVVLMGALAAFVKFTDGSDLGITAGAIIAFAAGIGILAGVMALLTLLDTGKLLAATTAMGGLIATIGLFSKLTNIGSLAQSAVGLVLFAVSLAALSIPIKMISEIPWQQLAATAGVIVASIGMFALVAATMPLFAASSALIGPALVGVLGVGGVILAIGAVVAAFGGLSKIPGVNDIINNGGELLQGIGSAIGRFVGGLVGGLAEGATAALPGIANNISAFGIAIQPFFESIKGVDTDGVEAVKYLAEALLILGGASIVDGITSWFTGGNTLSTFAAELKAFAPDFVSFANTLSSGNVNADVVKKTALAAKAMAELATELPNQGDSVSKWFVGDNTLSTFAAELKAFAPDFVSFANTLASGKIDGSIVDKTAKAAQAMSELAKTLPNQGGMAAWFTGDNTLSTFSRELRIFAPDFVSFANTLSTGRIDADVVKKTASAAKAMSELANELPNQGGMASWFTGDNTLSTFAAELALFAPDFVSFASALSSGDIDASVVSKTAVAAKAMSELATNLPNQGGMAAWFKGDNSLSAFAEELVKFAPKFVTFVNAFGSVKSDTVMPGIEALNSLVNILNISGKDSMSKLSKGFEDNKTSSIRKIKKVLDDVVKSIDKYDDKMVVAGGNIVDGLIKGIRNKEKDVELAAKEVMADGVTLTIAKVLDMHSPARKLIDSGKNVMQGFINGISSKKTELTNTLKSVVGDTPNIVGSSSLTKGLEDLLANLTADMGIGGIGAGDAFASGFDASNFSSMLDGVTKTGSGAASKIKTAFEKFKEWMDEQKFFDKITTGEEIKAWEEQQKIYKKGTDERKEIDRQLYTLRNRLIDETYQNEINKINKLNSYGQLSLEEELKRYREIRKEYKKGSKEREEIDKQIFDLEKKIYETRKNYIDDVRAAQAKADDDRLRAQMEYESAVSNAQSKAAKDRDKAQQKYSKGVQDAEDDAYKKRLDAQNKHDKSVETALERAAKNRINIEQDLADDIAKINAQLIKDIEAADQRYADTLKSRADTIYGYYGLFDSVSERDVSTPEELLKNLNDQNAAIEDWRHSLTQLADRGVSDELLKELEQLGVSSSGQLSAMLAMTDEQLAEFTSLFNRKHDLANTQAMSELQDYRKAVDNEIAALYEQADADVKARMDVFNKALADSNATLQTELDEAQSILTDALKEINATLLEKQTEAQTTLNETLHEINVTLQDELNSAMKTLSDTLTNINKETASQLKSLKDSFDKTMETIHDKSVEEYRAMNKDLKKELKTLNTETETELKTLNDTVSKKTEEAGKELSSNIKTGTNDAKEVLSTFNQEVSSLLSNFQRSLYDVGYNGARGLADGLRSGQYLAVNAGMELGQSALRAVMTALDVHSPSRALEKVGMQSDQGLAIGLVKNRHLVEDAGYSVGETALEALTNSLGRLTALDLMNVDLSPQITPVLDLSSIRRGANILSSLISSGQSYDLAATSLRQSKHIPDSQNGTKEVGSITITNHFNLENLTVRNETDIDAISNKLYQKQQSSMRGRGLRRAYNT